MTTHTDLIARLREMAGRLRLEAADALESLEQQVAALTSAVKDAEVVCDSYAAENQRLSDEKDTLTKERDELEISNAFAHGEWRAVKDQLAALTKERNHLQSLTVVNESLPVPALRRQLAAAQARESRLREALEYFGTLKLSDGTYADKNCVAVMALTLPTDDSALKERLEEEMGNADVTGLAPRKDEQ